jgi:hypothetical protein
MQGYKKLIFTTASLVCLLIPAQGQNTNSPYSRYGYGVLTDQSVGASKAMGGISYGVRGNNTNPGNPASYSGVDSLTFIFDVGVSYVKSKYNDGTSKQNDDNGGLDYVTMQFPIAKKLGMSIGLLPFSSVGYEFGSVENKNNLIYQNTFSGSGGFNQVYVGLAYQPIRNLSVGANVSYLFGNTTYNRSLNIKNVSGANAEFWFHKLTMNALKFDFGVQYALQVSNKDEIILGAIFSPRIKKSGKIDQQHNIVNTAGTSISGDTAVYTGKNAHADIPNTFGVGFTWNRNENITVGADVTYQDWSKVRYSSYLDDNLEQSNRFNDRWRVNAGIEYAIAPRERSFFKRMKFRGGFNYSNSYINVKNNLGQLGKYNEYGITFGVGLPIKDISYSGRTSYVNINFEYTNLKPNISNMIKEQYYGVSVNVNINELWFLKNKFR